jgi:hypothetical protein
MEGVSMNLMKFLGLIFILAVGSVLGWWAIKESWFLSVLTGPMQHLGLAVSTLNNSSEYLDGVSRLTGGDYLAASLHLAVWVFGSGVLVFYSKRTISKPAIILISIGWCVIGVLNLYLFSIRSV